MHKASRIREKLDHSFEIIGGGENGEDVAHRLQTAARELNSLDHEDQEFGAMAKQCENLYYELEDFLYGLNGLISRYDFDAEELEKTENRLEAIRKVTRRFK